MIEEKTLFILGAGASIPYGFPSAQGLRESTIKKFENLISELLHKSTYSESIQAERTLKQVRAFQEKFYLSNIKSIDYFLMRNPSFLDVGKSAIYIQLLKSESESKFAEDSYQKNSDWYFHLFNRILSKTKIPCLTSRTLCTLNTCTP